MIHTLFFSHILMKHYDTHWCKIETEQTLLLHIKHIIVIGLVERLKKPNTIHFCIVIHSA